MAFGCDPVRKAQQTCLLSVADAQSGSPIAGTAIHLKYDFERSEGNSIEFNQLSEEMREDVRQFWERRPWSIGVTDANGHVVIRVNTASLDRTRGDIPPPERDVITDKAYLVKIPDIGSGDEAISILMKPEERVAVATSSVTVIRIGKPRYVESSQRVPTNGAEDGRSGMIPQTRRDSG